MALLIPEHKTSHSLDTLRKRVDNHAVMDAIFFVLRSGCQWNASNIIRGMFIEFCTPTLSGIAQCRRLWGLLAQLLFAAKHLDSINWSCPSIDGCITKSSLSGTKNRPQPYGQRVTRRKKSTR